MQGGGNRVCNFKSSDGEGLIEKMLFEKRPESGGGNKCKDPEVEAYLSFFGKYIEAADIGEVR